MHIRFKRGNQVPYFQDWHGVQGIPWHVTFTVTAGPRPDLLTLRAPGYGVLDRRPRQYGNGALFVCRTVLDDEACVIVAP